MAVEPGPLIFVLDQNLGRHMLGLLRQARICPDERLTSLAELGFAGDKPDEDWMPELGKLGSYVCVTRDGNILNAAVRRDAWLSSGIGIIMLDKKWGHLPISEWARRVLYWWPAMIRRAEGGPAGAAWTVPNRIGEPQEANIRQITGEVPRKKSGGRIGQ